MNLVDLKTALKSSDSAKRTAALRKFAGSDFGLEALPVLRQLLNDNSVQVVLGALACIGKLGPEALTCPAGEEPMDSSCGDEQLSLEWQLYVLGGRVWGYSLMANCYSACLETLVKLKADEDSLVDFIHMHIGLSADDFLESVKALQALGTPEATDLIARGAAFWRPELNKGQTKKLDKLLGK